ncbi:30S ribosomal protein S18 [Candidatus Peregrinibacteria bacterium]|jgi:small subunit ribosomal protein S18|nr:30S ribosomal protein S18 [Candidatus Peregrinibacteria bacterium]MBT4631512.1 30S ribosomal protein S18 [Candidatus Peregrinibacteria bacterium]MBT5516993.1 30S ribosomal protein S18 [Candidatus Peregrinibacteria bacterium]MBT5823901.1 30S ribosomal protein S18 [Candidatus Peregrinibacteria bacterium]
MTKKVSAQKTERPEIPDFIDYKNVELLRAYLTVFGKIVPRYYSGTSLKQQKQLSRAIKQAREMGMLPYTSKY